MLGTKKQIIIAVAIAACFVNSCKTSQHSKVKQNGTWQTQAIIIDGDNKDWPSPYPEYDEKASLGYAVSNDKENLYITVETGDPATQLKILRQGFTVWIDKTGGKEQTTGIHYPLQHEGKNNFSSDGQQQQTTSSRSQWQQRDNSGNNTEKRRLALEDRVRAALDDANAYSLEGFKSCNKRFSLLEKDTCGIVVRVGLDSSNELVWEAVVPFKTFYPKSEISKSDMGKGLSVCFQTTGAKRPAGNNGGGNRGGGGGMSGGMHGGGMGFGGGMGSGMGMGMRMGGAGGGGRGMRSGGNSQNNSMMESLYKSTQTWKKFGIAWQ